MSIKTKKRPKSIDSCWKNYEAIGMKKKGKRLVPNCVPIKNGSARSAKSAKITKKKRRFKYSKV
mgnify:CR=1 FL=1